MSYRDTVLNVFKDIIKDIETVQTEVDELLDMNDIEEIKLHLSDLGQTLQTLKEGLE